MSESAGDNSKPRVVVLGGCGFIGRNLVEYLISNDLVSALRVVDKTPPQLAFLNPTHSKCFEDPRVEYRSANLINPSLTYKHLGNVRLYHPFGKQYCTEKNGKKLDTCSCS